MNFLFSKTCFSEDLPFSSVEVASCRGDGTGSRKMSDITDITNNIAAVQIGGRNTIYIYPNVVPVPFANVPTLDNAGGDDKPDTKPDTKPDVKPDVKPEAKPDNDNSIIILGIIGTDSEGNTYCPQKLTYIFNKSNKDANIIKATVEKAVDEWNSIAGCNCAAFCTEMPWGGTPITAISGHDHGFANKVFPVKNVGAAKGAAKAAVPTNAPTTPKPSVGPQSASSTPMSSRK